MAPEAKVLATFLLILSVAITPREAFWAFAVYGGVLASLIVVARVPANFVFSRLVAITPFVLFALLLPFIGTGTKTEVLGISVSVQGVWAMWNILVKAVLGASFSILLAATTETPQILRGMNKLSVPAIFTSIASFMIRYLEVVAGELSRMRIAMASRGYRPRWIGEVGPIAAASGALFIRSYERGERVYEAMLARGYTGTMPAIAQTEAGRGDWVMALAVSGLTMLTAFGALATS